MDEDDREFSGTGTDGETAEPESEGQADPTAGAERDAKPEEEPAPDAPEQDAAESFSDEELTRDLESGSVGAPPPDSALEIDPSTADSGKSGEGEQGEAQTAPDASAAEAQAGLSIPSKPKPCKEAVEALLFAAESPLTPNQISALLGKAVKPGQAKEWVDQLAQEYDETGRAFQVEEIAGGFRVMTRAEWGHYVRALRITEKSSRLSEAAIDTLSVIAYKQPIIKADINQIRGVESGPILKTLIEKNLVKAVGRSEVAGRPIMYGTSKKFLDHFGLKSLKDLPKPEK